MKHLAIIFNLALSLSCCGQLPFGQTKISSPTSQIVKRIERVNQLMDHAVYSSGIRPEQFDNFIELKRTATKDELKQLINHTNGVVRCYAFWALAYDTTVDIFPIVVAHLTDTALVRTQFGCIGSRESVGDFFIEVVTPEYIDLDVQKLDSNKLSELDSLLLFTNNNLSAKEQAISKTAPKEKYYARIRELVVKQNNQAALVTLAKFNKQQDISLILKNAASDNRNQYFYTYKAICQFPDSAFLPLLRKNLYPILDDDHYSNEWSQLYNAIASYKNATALALLKIPFTNATNRNIRQYHIRFIFGAVQSFYSPLYDELLWTMWEKEKLIDTDVFALLSKKNPEKAFALTKKTLQNADDFYYLATAQYDDDQNKKPCLIEIMLDTVINRDALFAIELINKNIRVVNVHEFPIFANKALKLKASSSVNSLLSRLEKEDNPHIYLKATNVLIAFNDKKINKQILEIYKRNTELHKDWGGEEFAKLLKENNIN